MPDLPTLDRNLPMFVNAVKQGESVYCRRDGRFFTEGSFVRNIRQIFKLENFRLIRVAQVFCDYLDRLERQPVRFDGPSSRQQRIFDLGISAGRYLLKSMEHCTQKTAVKWREELRYRVVALGSRSEIIKPLSGPDAEYYSQVERMAETWKKQQIRFDTCQELTNRDKRALRRLCCYPEASKQLIDNEQLRQQFFYWTLNCHNSVQAFVEYPAMQQKINDCALASRLGFHGHLRVYGRTEEERRKQNIACKDLVMRFEVESKVKGERKSRWISILDPKRKVDFGGFSASIRRIFRFFKRYDYRWPRFESFEAGLSLWNPIKWGRYNGITQEYDLVDLNKNLAKQLPVLKWIPLAKAKKRYHGVDLQEGRTTVGMVRTTRLSKQLIADGTHAFSRNRHPQ